MHEACDVHLVDHEIPQTHQQSVRERLVTQVLQLVERAEGVVYEPLIVCARRTPGPEHLLVVLNGHGKTIEQGGRDRLVDPRSREYRGVAGGGEMSVQAGIGTAQALDLRYRVSDLVRAVVPVVVTVQVGDGDLDADAAVQQPYQFPDGIPAHRPGYRNGLELCPTEMGGGHPLEQPLHVGVLCEDPPQLRIKGSIGHAPVQSIVTDTPSRFDYSAAGTR